MVEREQWINTLNTVTIRIFSSLFSSFLLFISTLVGKSAANYLPVQKKNTPFLSLEMHAPIKGKINLNIAFECWNGKVPNNITYLIGNFFFSLSIRCNRPKLIMHVDYYSAIYTVIFTSKSWCVLQLRFCSDKHFASHACTKR